MTPDELRKMLDRFRLHLDLAGTYIVNDPNVSENPTWFDGLDAVWRDLSRYCALMKDAEGQTVTTLDQTAVKPTRPLPEPPARMSAAAVNAEQIGKLQARVSEIEGTVKAAALLPPIHRYGEIQGHRFIMHTSGHRYLCEYCAQWITLAAAEGECCGSIATTADGSVPE